MLPAEPPEDMNTTGAILLILVGVAAALGFCFKAKKGLFAPKAAAGGHESIYGDSVPAVVAEAAPATAADPVQAMSNPVAAAAAKF